MRVAKKWMGLATGWMMMPRPMESYLTPFFLVKHKGDEVRAANLICGCGGNREVMRYDE